MDETVSVEMRDQQALAHIEKAEEHIHAALRALPNRAASIFMATDPRDLDRALRSLQTVSRFARTALDQRKAATP